MDENPQNSGLIAMVPRYAVGMPGDIFSPIGRNGSNSALVAVFAGSAYAGASVNQAPGQAGGPTRPL